jgi:hypothetical protein
MTEYSKRQSISMITKDKFDILKYLEERVDVIKTVKNLINKWSIKPDEILKVERVDENFSIEDEDYYRTEYSEEALRYSINVHDLFDLDYECKICLARAICCRFSNIDNIQRRGECYGISRLLTAPIIIKIEDYYIQKGMETDT